MNNYSKIPRVSFAMEGFQLFFSGKSKEVTVILVSKVKFKGHVNIGVLWKEKIQQV